MKTLPKRGLRKPTEVPGYSMDQIDRASFRAGADPFVGNPATVSLRVGAPNHPEPPAALSLDGQWQMAEGGSERDRLDYEWSDAIPAAVPGSVHAALEKAGLLPDQTMGRNQQIAKQESFKTWWFAKQFQRPKGRGPFRLVFDGVCVHCTVWLNGRRLGSHEGMFGGPAFDITSKLRDENELLVKIEPALDGESRPETNFYHKLNVAWRDTVVFNNVYGWHYTECPSLGIWQGVRIESTPTVSIDQPFIRTLDTDGSMELVADLTSNAGAVGGTVKALIEPVNFKGKSRTFSLPMRVRTGMKKLHVTFRIPDPQLWWPVDMGKPNLYRMTLTYAPQGKGKGQGKVEGIEEALISDTKSFTFGIRTVEMAPLPEGPKPDKYDWTFVVNGKPMFMKGTGWCTMDPLMDFRRERYERFLTMARNEHCQMVRAWGSGMPETDDFYDLCDQLGLLVMQEWPTAWNSHLDQPYDVLEETVRLNTLRLRNRASLVMWCAGNESTNPFGKAIDMMGRLAIELDNTRPFHRAQPWGGSKHGYPAYWERQHPDHHLRATADFWGEFGLASYPMHESVQRYLPKEEQNLWPAPQDGAFAYHTPCFNRRFCMDRIAQQTHKFVPMDCGMEELTIGSQMAQVICLRHQLERARARWPHCSGALLYKLNDNFPAASWATVDWYGAAKISHYFVQDAFAPLHACVLFDSVNNVGCMLNQPVFLLDDADQLNGKSWKVHIRAYNGELKEAANQTFAGKGSIDAAEELGRFTMHWRDTETVPLLVVAEVVVGRKCIDRTFYFVNYEPVKGCLLKLPRTRLKLQSSRGKRVTVTNTGRRPAVGVNIARPGKLDTFTVSDNYFWLDAGESRTVMVNHPEGLTVDAWNAGKTRPR